MFKELKGKKAQEGKKDAWTGGLPYMSLHKRQILHMTKSLTIKYDQAFILAMSVFFCFYYYFRERWGRERRRENFKQAHTQLIPHMQGSITPSCDHDLSEINRVSHPGAPRGVLYS